MIELLLTIIVFSFGISIFIFINGLISGSTFKEIKKVILMILLIGYIFLIGKFIYEKIHPLEEPKIEIFIE